MTSAPAISLPIIVKGTPATLSVGLTSFDVDILTPDLAGGVLGSAVVRVVVDQLAEAGWQEVEDLEGSIGVDVADAGDIVDLLAGRQIPA